MAFFETFKRIVQGKPPFEAPKPDGQDQQSTQQTQAAPTARSGPKVIPEVEIERTTSRSDGSRMQVTCIIQNNSQGVIELDKIQLLGTSLELDNFLRPGEERQYNVYNGNRLQHTNYRTAELYYKDASGDYFCANHNIEYDQEADNTYVITEMQLQRPIRDV
jgi:hypothetical protein